MQVAFAEYVGQLNPVSPCHTETVADVRRAMRDGGAVLAWIDGVAVGSARFALHGDHFFVSRVSVLPDYRGCGVACAMMNYLESLAVDLGCMQMELSSRLSLPRNVALYERLGFHIVESHQVSPDADVQVTMVRELPVLVNLPVSLPDFVLA
jgi:ribosomal protein S18 acetylase RimI-like enzyme